MENQRHTEQDEAIAIAALSWIAADGEQISRFIALSGIEPDQFRHAAGQPGFLAGVLEFLMGHEPSLMRFCEDNELDPQNVNRAWQRLSGGAMPGPGDFTG